MTRDEILKIETLSDEELAQIEGEAKQISWDLKIGMLRLTRILDEMPQNRNPFINSDFKELCECTLIFGGSLPLGKESALSKTFEGKWEKLEPLLSDKTVKMYPTKEILETWGQALAYTFDSAPIYQMLATTYARLNTFTPSYQITELVAMCQKISETLSRTRREVFKMVKKLAEHDGLNSDTALNSFKEVCEQQKALFGKTRPNE